MNKQDPYIWLQANTQDGEIPSWKLVDLVCRKWAVLSGMEKDLSDYQKRKELYE